MPLNSQLLNQERNHNRDSFSFLKKMLSLNMPTSLRSSFVFRKPEFCYHIFFLPILFASPFFHAQEHEIARGHVWNSYQVFLLEKGLRALQPTNRTVANLQVATRWFSNLYMDYYGLWYLSFKWKINLVFSK